ncbi:hypothetical protein [Aquimarina algiphila]|uniref:hypothetical protein n=1 Tax=Aquimarina algiphila TaxID=2047982 RepID=UPI00232A9B3F|nr:hypothetical protein [Aquimarina algiphila]
MINKYKYPCKNIIAFDNPHERWVQMRDIFQGNYFVSSEGRIMLMRNGFFKEIKPYKQNGYLRIGLYNQSKYHQPIGYMVAQLVLSYFVGGAHPRRRVAFKNKNKSDCRLINLYWKSGFDTQVDYEYLSKLKPGALHNDDIKVVEYFKTKDIQILFNLVESYTPNLYCVLTTKMLKYDVKPNIATVVLELSKRLLKGDYKPFSKFVKYETVSFFAFVVNLTLDIAANEKKYVLAPIGVQEEYFLNKAAHDGSELKIQ